MFTPSEFCTVQAARGAKGGKVSKGGGRPSNSGKARTDLLPEVQRLKAQGYCPRRGALSPKVIQERVRYEGEKSDPAELSIGRVFGLWARGLIPGVVMQV